MTLRFTRFCTEARLLCFSSARRVHPLAEGNNREGGNLQMLPPLIPQERTPGSPARSQLLFSRGSQVQPGMASSAFTLPWLSVPLR